MGAPKRCKTTWPRLKLAVRSLWLEPGNLYLFLSHARVCTARGRVIALSVNQSVSLSVCGHKTEHLNELAFLAT